MFRQLSVLALLACILTVAGSANADEAVEHEALILYQAKNYGAAAGAFAAAYAHTQIAEDLFAWAQAERLWGQCGRARALYVHYLGTNPPEQNRKAAEQGLQACPDEESETEAPAIGDLMHKGYVLSQSPWFLLAEAYVAERKQRCQLVRRIPARDSPVLAQRIDELAQECPRTEDTTETSTTPPSTETKTVTKATPSSPSWYEDPPMLMAIGGFGVALIGGGLAFLGQRSIDDASTTSYRDFVDDVDSGKRLRLIGLVTAGVGLAAGSFGLIRVLTRGDVQTEVHSGGATVSLAFEF